MIFAKDLILKGVAGLAVVGGSIGGGIYLWNQSQGKSLDFLIKNVGLKGCTTSGSVCEIDDEGVNVKQDSAKGKKTKSGTTGKIKVYTGEEANGYNEGFKFVIEEGDIDLNNGAPNKLEEFETYEITEEGGEYYLTRKTKVSDKIETDLVLPEDCKLPEDGSTPKVCWNVTNEQFQKIKFNGNSVVPTIGGTDGKVKLTITKLTDNKYPLGYKFGFQSLSSTDESSITIDGEKTILKQNQDTDFKIKKTGTGNSTTFSLEKNWTLEALTEKVGLECTGTPNGTTGVQCNKKTGSTTNIKVKQDADASIEVATISSGTIKVYNAEDTEDYNQGFKFVIEDNDISASTANKKLEQFETYEIKKGNTGNDWYLTRKTKVSDKIETDLVLPAGCKLPEDGSTSTCNLDEARIKAINFDGKNASGSYTANGNTTLKISKSSDTTTFPNGAYKFVFETNNDVIIPKTGSDQITIKANTNTEFKIKKSGTGNSATFSLEKAWTVTSLASKVGLTCQTGDTKECTLSESGNININNGDNNKYSGLTRGTGNEGKKVKYEENVEGFNQGFKFYTEEADGITLQNSAAGAGSDPNAANKKIEHKGSGDNVHYQILKDTDNKWYLTKKST